MTNAQQPGPTVHQIFAWSAGILNARNPKRAEAIIQDALNTAADNVKTQMGHMEDISGLDKGPPAYRTEVYTLKSQMEAQYGLWFAEKQEYPEYYKEDVVDAFELGALLPPWCELDAIAFGARVK